MGTKEKFDLISEDDTIETLLDANDKYIESCSDQCPLHEADTVSSTRRATSFNWKEWLTEPQFYQVYIFK